MLDYQRAKRDVFEAVASEWSLPAFMLGVDPLQLMELTQVDMDDLVFDKRLREVIKEVEQVDSPEPPQRRKTRESNQCGSMQPSWQPP